MAPCKSCYIWLLNNEWLLLVLFLIFTSGTNVFRNFDSSKKSPLTNGQMYVLHMHTPRGNRDTLIPKAKTNLSHSPKRNGPLSEVKMAVDFKGNIRVCCPEQNNKIIVKGYHSLISLKKYLLT